MVDNSVEVVGAIGRRIVYSTVQYCTVQYSTVQYSTVQYSTVQYSTVQYSTVQYSTERTCTITLKSKATKYARSFCDLTERQQ